MKRIVAILLAALMLLTMAACGTKEENGKGDETLGTTEATVGGTTETTVGTTTETTVGSVLLADFKANATGTAQQIADHLLTNGVIQFMGASMPVEEGLLTGFGETEITGFEEGVMFAPMIGTIPFVGYIFTLEDGADVEAFKTLLKDNANLRWNICTTAEELIVESEGSTVFFLMSPKSFEQPETGDTGAGGMDIAPGDGVPAA